MAAGDFRMKVTHIRIAPGSEVEVEYRYGVEDKAGAVEDRGEQLRLSWADFVALTTQEERDALQSIAGKLKAAVKAQRPKLSVALDA